MKRHPDSMNFPDEAPKPLRGVPVSFAVVIIAGVCALIISAKVDSDILRTVSSVIIVSVLIALGEINYKRYKYLFYRIVFAAIATGIGGGILVGAFIDWLY